MQFIRFLAMRGNPCKAFSACLALCLAGCANQYPSHIAYTDTSEEGALVTGIQTYQFNLTTGPRYMQAGAVAQNGQVGEKTGASTRHSTLFGLVEWGDNGVGDAAKQGGIREVRTVQNGGVDVIWGIVYSQQTTIVTGVAEYSNRLPIKMPKLGKILKEGMFLQPNGNIVVKNSQNLILGVVQKGEVGKKVSMEGNAICVSYGFEKGGERTILVEPEGNEGDCLLLINDQVITFKPKSALVMILDGEMAVQNYKSMPYGAVQIQPLTTWESSVASRETSLPPVGP
jgi:hypothetical protein